MFLHFTSQVIVQKSGLLKSNQVGEGGGEAGTAASYPTPTRTSVTMALRAARDMPPSVTSGPPDASMAAIWSTTSFKDIWPGSGATAMVPFGYCTWDAQTVRRVHVQAREAPHTMLL